MPRRLTPDYALVAAVLPREHRAALELLAVGLGLPAARWDVVPSLRLVARDVAALTLAGQMTELPDGEALSEALAALGLPDDTDRDTRPADSVARKFRRYQAAALGADKEVRSRNRPAA